MNKRAIAVALVVIALTLAFAPSATALSRSAPAPHAQASPPEECGIGQVCIQENQTDAPGQRAPLDPAKDPPGATVRSLVMLALMASGFAFYLRWAMTRGSIPR